MPETVWHTCSMQKIIMYRAE